ncbi:LytTR family DNA-binding domain-containing protein [Ruegeria aquimaris]|uniref:LytTR family transcriptional regulator n=1 Tax=Ruegeria aquimaris TaxID=2984333 RepID=A0ABT3AI22_9RHOB|nr:LytTR family DNA-binding domain-containing protein [Ruegeria sp. XHP0148]MCV2888326.1 LytTR family transcriptional regulator [Ruegeria sp. XHP0148]
MTPVRPLELHFLDGTSLCVDRKDVLTLMTCPVGVFIVVFSASIIHVLNVFMLGVPLAFIQALALGLVLAGVHWLTLTGLGLALTRIGRNRKRAVRLPVPLAGLATILTNNIPALWAVSRVFSPETWNLVSVWKVILLAYAVHLGFEFLFAALVVPMMKRKRLAEAAKDTALVQNAAEDDARDGPRARPDVMHLLLAGEPVVAEDIKLVEADEHYVFVHFADRKTHVRESFGSLVRALDKAAGMQVHKSYWVAFDHIHKVHSKRDGGLKLILKDKTAIPGARSRARAFREAFQRRGQPVFGAGGGAPLAGRDGAGR